MPVAHKTEAFKLVTIGQSVAFTGIDGGKCVSTLSVPLPVVWKWYETALDIAALPCTSDDPLIGGF